MFLCDCYILLHNHFYVIIILVYANSCLFKLISCLLFLSLCSLLLILESIKYLKNGTHTSVELNILIKKRKKKNKMQDSLEGGYPHPII